MRTGKLSLPLGGSLNLAAGGLRSKTFSTPKYENLNVKLKSLYDCLNFIYSGQKCDFLK